MNAFSFYSEKDKQKIKEMALAEIEISKKDPSTKVIVLHRTKMGRHYDTDEIEVSGILESEDSNYCLQDLIDL